MKMGEVVETAADISHQRLQVASTVAVEDEDEDDAENVREVNEYLSGLRSLSLLPLHNSPRNEQVTTSNSTHRHSHVSTALSERTKAISPTKHVIPRHLDRKRRIVNRKYQLAVKRAAVAGSSPLQSLRASKEFDLRFLEASYVRNVLFQTLPHSKLAASGVVANARLSPDEALSKSASSVDSSDRTKCCNVNSTNHKLDENVEWTFANDDDDGYSSPPKPTFVAEFSNAWYEWLRQRALNVNDPDHLIKISYDKYASIETSRQLLFQRAEKEGLTNNCDKSSATSVVSLTANNETSLSLTEKTSVSSGSSSHINNTSAGACVATSDEKLNQSTSSQLSPTGPSSSPSTFLNAQKPDCNSASSSLTKNVSAVTFSPSTPIASSSNSTASTLPLQGVLNKSIVDTPNPTTSETPMRPRSLKNSREEKRGRPPLHSREDSRSGQTTLSPTKEEAEGGRDGRGRKSVGSRKALVASVDVPVKPGFHASSTIDDSDLGLKPVINENTDSSSSTSTSVSSSSGSNDNLSISRASQNAPNPSQSSSKHNASSSGSTSSSNDNSAGSSHSGEHSVKSNKRFLSGPKAPKKYSEKMKAEASVLQRISELQKEGMWWERRLPKVYEPQKAKSHWDYLLEEMTWMSTDFTNERKWKRATAKKCARMIEKYFHDKDIKRQKAEKEEEVRKKKTAAGIAKLVRQFWSNVRTVVEFKEQTIIESLRKQALDQKLSYLVNETEKYSEIVAQTFTAIAKKTGIENGDVLNEDGIASSKQADSLFAIKGDNCDNPISLTEDDVEFVPPSDEESDVDDTIAEEEAKEREASIDHRHELEELQEENNMSVEELRAKYAKYLNNPGAFEEPQPVAKGKQQQPAKPERPLTRGRVVGGRTLRGRRPAPSKLADSDVETDPDNETPSSTEEEDEDESDEEAERNNDEDLACLLKSISPEKNPKKNTEEESNKLADLAESFKPKGNTLSSTTVVTKVPHLIRHSLREYQHIGLDWLVTMYDKKLNGILADEMGLGKTIQTIALLAYLAVDRGNWGPHLIIVPTSVMLNWEMEFKKWCPGFKILTYYGSQKERKLKRSGWTKPNAFHVCITSYKLVIQDHQSFRRKRWKYLILDEAQNIKNFKSQRWQLLLNFHTQRRLLLTGTPLQNNLMELWSLLHFLMPNVFQSHMEFKDWFSSPMTGMVEGNQDYDDEIVRRLHKVIRPFILRRMKSEVEKQLPQKYEHVVMCSLSKRQRFLYEEFMSRTKTKETLNQGNLLSVINVLMQLRKVCNHPNLFEPRPIVSPFQTNGISYTVPSLAWDLLKELQESSFRQYSPFFTLTNPNNTYSEDDARRIGELTPLFAYNPDEERRYVMMNYAQVEIVQQPPAKRIRRIVNLDKNEPPSCPRLQKPLTFFMAKGKPDKYLQDRDFVDYLRQDVAQKQGTLRGKKEKDDGSRRKPDNNKGHAKSSKTSATDTITLESSDSENDGSSSDSEFEVVSRKRKVPIPVKFNVTTRLQYMGCTVPDFQLNYIQERKLSDRKTVVNNLNKVNWARCRVKTFMNQQLVELCQVVGALPPLRLTSKLNEHQVAPIIAKDSRQPGCFIYGIDEITRIIRIREEFPELMNHPLVMWSITKHLDSLILTPTERVRGIMDVLKRYVMYIPAVSAPALEKQIYRPSTSSRYFAHLNQVDEYRNQFSKATDIVHPIVSRMLTQFPDPRLIQYDCGKLQTLDTLLRRLKVENHRVLIFTQMAKVLDILEAFLNYHGHTYLRLDGATKIDQRQLLMERFNADKKIFCFILSTRSGGIGVNLTGADTVIFYDSDWNPTMDAQAQDRCHRIGQTRDVHIYRLVSEKTVEENILKKSNQKRLLGELAIEGGKFTTTYFKQNTIRELFTINEKDDVAKRLNSWDAAPTPSPGSKQPEEEATLNPSDLMRSPEKKHEMQMIECALAAAEDDTDVQAAQTVHAEAEAEMAEFDENVSLDALDDGKFGPNRFEQEFSLVFEQLTDVERYALRLMESTIDDWSKETVAQAQRDLEEQKMVWELQQKNLQDGKPEQEDDTNLEDMLTYPRMDNMNQVWVAQFGNMEQEMLFPIYEPLTPPHDEMDVYFDTAHGYLYDYGIMSEAQLPPVYVPKHPKKPVTPVSSPVPKLGIEKTPEPAKETPPEPAEVESDPASATKKSPKVGRREDYIFAPKSLFERPTPALTKLRRDLRLQRYNQRPASSSPKTLGPGSVTFPISTNLPKTPPPPMPADSPDWLYSEDSNLLQSVRNVLELPPSLLVVNLAQTPNWDYAQEHVNSVGYYHRTAKHCKWRYENVVAPREEGKLMYDPPCSDPSSPSSGKKKKTKTFIKIAPPSPSKASRSMKVSQLLSQDNNAQFRNIYTSKFDTIKQIANKRAPTTKPAAINPSLKLNKHSQVIGEYGINYENPLNATSIAQARYDRIQLERKKLEIARQQQQQIVTVPANAAPPTNTPPPVSLGGVPQTILNTTGSAAMAAAISAASVNQNAGKPRGTFTPLNMSPLVIQASSADMVHRDVNIPNIITQQRTRHAELTPQQQQQLLLQQKQALAQAQSLTSLLNQQPQNAPPSIAAPSSQPQPNVTVLATGPVPVVGTTQSPVQTSIRPPAPATVQMHQAPPQPPPQSQAQTVVLASGLAQALAASGGSPIAVSNSGVNSLPNMQTAVSTTPSLSTVARHLQPTIATSPQQMQRLPTITMQDLVSSATPTQRIQTGIITTSAGTVQSVAPPQPAVPPQPTLVSLTPMLGNANPQLTTKLLQNPQGIATLVQSPQARSAAPTSLSQQPGKQMSQLPLQYLRGGLIRQSSPVTSSVSQQQQVQQIKEHLMSATAASQIKRIQVVAAPPPSTIVSSSSVLPQQPPPNPVSLSMSVPSGSSMPTVSTYSTIPMAQNPTCPPVVTMSSAAPQSKVALSQPNATMAISTPTSSPATATVMHQQTQRQLQVNRLYVLVDLEGSTDEPGTFLYSVATDDPVYKLRPVLSMMPSQPKEYAILVKQQTVGGKTITRPVTDAEMAALLKQHGLPTIQSPVSVQSMISGSKNPVATFQGSVPVQGVQGSPTLLTVGLQNLMKVQPSPSGSVATIVKTPTGQTVQQTTSGALAFPIHVSKINTKSPSPVSTAGSPKQPPVQQQTNLGMQQLMIQRRQQDQPPQSMSQQQPPPQPVSMSQVPQSLPTPVSVSAAGGKITHLTTQVNPPGSLPTHVVVQKQLPQTIAVQQLQQVFKQVGATSQVISQGGQVLQAQMLPKGSQLPNQTITVTTIGTTVRSSSPTLSMPPSSATSTASLVHIPTNIVQAAGSSQIHARIVPVSVNLASPQPVGGVKPTIQVVSAGPPPPNAAALLGSPLTVRPPPPVVSNTQGVQPMNSIQIKMPTSTSAPNVEDPQQPH